LLLVVLSKEEVRSPVDLPHISLFRGRPSNRKFCRLCCCVYSKCLFKIYSWKDNAFIYR